MAGSVGQVYYDVLPNLDGFAAKVASGLGKAKPIKIPVEADTKAAEASAKKLTAAQVKEAQRSSAQRMALLQRDAIAENKFRDRAVASEKRSSAQKMALIQRDAIAENKFRDRAAAATEKAAARQVVAQQKIAASQQKAAAAAAAQQKAARGAAAGSLGTGLLVGGAATAAALGGIVKVTADFDAAVSNVASTGKEASASIGQLREEAIKYGASTSFSATEAANAQAELIKANVSVTDTINGGLKGALDLAAAGSLDVASAAGIMGTAMSQFNLPGTEASHVADLLAAAAGKAQGEVQDFAEALKYVGPLAASAGVSIEETTGVLAMFANEGILGSQAGTNLRGIFLGLTAPVGAGAKAIEKYGINVRDAAGNFIGLEGAAGELQKRLGGLGRAERDAALASIFGRQQVTAATILYEEGAAGVQRMTKSVNDLGYANTTAATKMDNLKGDVEQLKGAIDSAFIQSGSGGTTFLRGLAQDATGAIDSFNSLSPAVQQGAFKFAAIGAATLLATGGLIKLTGGIASATTGLVALGAVAPATAAKIGTLTAALGPAAAAFVAVAAGATLLNSLDRPAKSVEELSGSLEKIAAGQGNLNDAFTGPNWAGELAGFLSGGVTPAKDLASALRGLEVSQDTLPGKFKRFQESITPGVQSMERAEEQVTALDDALVSMVSKGQTEQAGDAIKRLGIEGKDVARFLPQYSNALKEAGDAAAGSFRAGERAFTNGGAAAGGIKQTGQAAELTADQIQEMTDALYANASASLAASGNAIAVEAAIDAASASFKENGDTLDINTQKGRNNQTALDNLVASTLTATKAMDDQGAPLSKIAELNERAKASYIRNADAMGKTKGEATDLANELFALPQSVTSQVVVSGAKVSRAEAKGLNAALKGVPKETRARIVTIANTKGAKAAATEIAKVKSKSVIAKATGKGVNTVKEIDGAIKKLKSKAVRAEAKAAGKKATDALDAAIRKLKGKRVDVVANPSGEAGVRSLRSEINKVQGKTVTVRVKKEEINASGGVIGWSRGLPGYAGGGVVRGSGGPREDNIAMIDRMTGVQTSWGSVGEMVTNAVSTANNRQVLETINANPNKKYDLVQRLNRGGVIDGKASKAATSGGARSLTLNLDLGPVFGGVQQIVVDLMDDRDEYSASIGRM